jgi:hypothetical protein
MVPVSWAPSSRKQKMAVVVLIDEFREAALQGEPLVSAEQVGRGFDYMETK